MLENILTYTFSFHLGERHEAIELLGLGINFNEFIGDFILAKNQNKGINLDTMLVVDNYYGYEALVDVRAFELEDHP